MGRAKPPRKLGGAARHVLPALGLGVKAPSEIAGFYLEGVRVLTLHVLAELEVREDLAKGRKVAIVERHQARRLVSKASRSPSPRKL